MASLAILVTFGADIAPLVEARGTSLNTMSPLGQEASLASGAFMTGCPQTYPTIRPFTGFTSQGLLVVLAWGTNPETLIIHKSTPLVTTITLLLLAPKALLTTVVTGERL